MGSVVDQSIVQVLLQLLQGSVKLFATWGAKVLLAKCAAEPDSGTAVEPFHDPVALWSTPAENAELPRKFIVSGFRMQKISRAEGVGGVSTEFRRRNYWGTIWGIDSSY